MPRKPAVDHELGTAGDQDIVKGPAASDDAIFVPIGSTDDLFEADLLADALADAGIPVAARAQKDHLLDPLVNPLVPFWVILVPSDRADEAGGLLTERLRELHLSEREGEAAARAEEQAGEV